MDTQDNLKKLLTLIQSELDGKEIEECDCGR